MTPDETKSIVTFLATASRISLGNFLLAKYNKAANLEKEIRELGRELVQCFVFIELAAFLRAQPRKDGGLEYPVVTTPLNAFPVTWWKWIIRRRDLSSKEKLLALTIKADSDGLGEWEGPEQELVENSGLSESTVRRAARGLEEKGLYKFRRTGRGIKVTIGQIDRSERSNWPIRPVTETDQSGHTDRSERSQGPDILIPKDSELLRGPKPSRTGRVSQDTVNGSRRQNHELTTDDDKLSRFLLGKFKPDLRFPALELPHIEFAIGRIRERATTPPGSLEFWLTAIEKFLIDFGPELRAAEKQRKAACP
jgi:hypothetical protein